MINTKNETFNNHNLEMSIWFIPSSDSINDLNEEFPIPHEFVPEMIKSLVATFSLMKQAKEDVINDNIDIT